MKRLLHTAAGVLLCAGLLLGGPDAAFAGDPYGIPAPAHSKVHVRDPYDHGLFCRDLFAIKKEYGSLLKVRALGRSLDNRVIFDLAVGNPDAPKKILLTAGIHGREYITCPLLFRGLEELLHAAARGGTLDGVPLDDILWEVQVHVIPEENPDGIAISQFGAEGLEQPSLRDTLRAAYEADGSPGSFAGYLRRWKTNAAGVDLNLNFDAGWGGIENVMHPTNEKMNPGPQPFSEPETVCVRDLVLEESFDIVISYHAIGNVIYWDSAFNKAKEESEALARAAAEVTGYDVRPSSKSAGGLKDWMQCGDNPVPGITIEVGSEEAPVPFSEFPSIWSKNRGVIAMALRWVLSRP